MPPAPVGVNGSNIPSVRLPALSVPSGQSAPQAAGGVGDQEASASSPITPRDDHGDNGRAIGANAGDVCPQMDEEVQQQQQQPQPLDSDFPSFEADPSDLESG